MIYDDFLQRREDEIHALRRWLDLIKEKQLLKYNNKRRQLIPITIIDGIKKYEGLLIPSPIGGPSD